MGQILLYLLLLVYIAKSKAFSYHETINSVPKSFEESDYSVGPEFDEYGKFAYVKVKELRKIPPTIYVSLYIFDKSSSTVSQSSKKFVADRGSKSISVTSFKFFPIVLTTNEKKENGENKTLLVRWEPFAYPDPYLNLPDDHTVVPQGGADFDVLLSDNVTCPNISMCKKAFRNNQYSQKNFLSNGDLIWSNMRIRFESPNSKVFLVSGYDIYGNYKFVHCKLNGQCLLVYSLPNANSSVEAHLFETGFCFIENPGTGKSVRCFSYYISSNDKVSVTCNKTVTYEKPISLLQVKDTLYPKEIILIAKTINCGGADCLNIIVNKVPMDPDDKSPIIYRDLTLECSNEEELLKVYTVIKDSALKTLAINYICENHDEFIFKSATISNS